MAEDRERWFQIEHENVEKQFCGRITMEEVQHYITHPGLEEELLRQMVEIRKDLLGLDNQNTGIEAEIYQTIQEGVHYDDTGGSRSGKKKDLGDLLSVTQKMIQSHRRELSVRYQMLLAKSEQYHRLGLVYDTLDSASKEVLRRLYVDKEKWEWIEADMNISHRKLLNIRKQAMKDMLERYHSDLSNYQLAMQSTFTKPGSESEQHHESKSSTGMTGQILLTMPEGKEKVK